MKRKVILISIDGMRPDGLLQCQNPYVQELMGKGAYTLEGLSVYPPITIPCHVSIFHSVPPKVHGITSNNYVPMAKPVKGLFEQIRDMGGKSAFYYGWKDMRQVCKPDFMAKEEYIWSYQQDNTDRLLTETALEYIKEEKPDFVFLYMVETDQKGGHDNGWMTKPYLKCIHDAIESVKLVLDQVAEEYTVIITADHGGHDCDHGMDIPEDMLVPMFFIGPDFTPGEKLSNVTLLELAPTIAQLMDIPAVKEWGGHSVLNTAEE